MSVAFTCVQKVLFRHCDPAGIVFFPRYFEMINDCTEAFFDEALGAPFAQLHRTAGVPTAAIETTFLAPSRHGDALLIDLTPTRLGRSSLALRFDARCGDEPRFTARSTLVYVDAGGKPQRWPRTLRDALTPLIGDPE